ncbi:MAG: alpha,alpha-trehalase [Ruminococcaceae bacterium]|nr:alpha,alpha-trehalase [Oscillospiraceae bacterium]
MRFLLTHKKIYCIIYVVKLNKGVPDMLKEKVSKQLSECICFAEEDEKNIGLPYPYSVPTPGKTFRALYYWDTYFTNLGLICSGNVRQARQNVDDMLYMVERFGLVPNGSQKRYLSRSQPPFLSMMVKDVFEVTKDTEWLSVAYSGLEKEYDFWTKNRTAPNGLAHYGYTPTDPAMEALGEKWLARTNSTSTAPLLQLAGNFLAEAESGWDFSPRFNTRAQYFCPPDLNSILWELEKNMAHFSHVLNNGDEKVWQERADKRAERMNAILWRDTAFSDVDYQTGETGKCFSVAAYYPMFVGMATEEQAQALHTRLPELEGKFGIYTCASIKTDGVFQWAAPNVWPCLQWIMYVALKNYGYDADAERIARKYIDMVEDVEAKTGQLWEKYNADTGSCDAACEYQTPPMLGWTAGVYLKLLEEIERKS